jgi:hypothetical protein
MYIKAHFEIPKNTYIKPPLKAQNTYTNHRSYSQHFIFFVTYEWSQSWTNFSLQDKPWAEFSTLEVAAACIPCTYCPV